MSEKVKELFINYEYVIKQTIFGKWVSYKVNHV